MMAGLLMRRFMLCFALCVGVTLLSTHARSLSIAPTWVGDNDLRARFLINDDADKAALYIKLQEGWHTYWHTPGDAGLPPRFEWKNEVNIKSITPRWPVPQRFDEMGFTTIGYADEVRFPLDIKSIQPGRPMTADLTLNIMICKEICIPKKLDIKLNTFETISKVNGDEKILAQSFARLPQTTSPDMSLENVQIFKDHIETTISFPEDITDADLEALDLFAVVYDTPDTPVDQGTALTGKVTKIVDPNTNQRAKLHIAKTSDIDDLNLHTRGKNMHIVITKNDHGIFRDIRLPSPEDKIPHQKRSRETIQ